MSFSLLVKPFLEKSPFHDRIAALIEADSWIRWAGHFSPAKFESVQSEYFAIRNGASVYDVSPLIKYLIRGRDAARFVDHLVTRDVTKVRPGNAFYTAWCEDQGMMVEEGTLFRLGDNEFLLNAAKDQLHWLDQVAYGFQVQIEEWTHSLCGLSLQGPMSASILSEMGIPAAGQMPRFGIHEFNLGPGWLRLARVGFTGDLGFELWTRPEHAGWLWDKLFAAGAMRKIAPIGARALEIARIEAGYLLIDADYSGALHALRPSARTSPFECGIGWAVHLDKSAYFVGKRALAREKTQGLSRHVLVGLEIEGRKPAPNSFLYADKAGGREIGITTSAIWSPTLKKNIAYGRLPSAHANPGTELWVEIWYGKEHKIERSMVRCRVVKRRFFQPVGPK